MKTVKVLLLIILFMLSGCYAQNPIIKYEYVTVEVPVVYEIDRPNRPHINSNDSIPGYLSKILTYTKTLEVIIDEAKLKIEKKGW